MVPNTRLALMKDVPIMPLKEEFVSDMVPKSRHVRMKDVPITYRMEEFVRGMVPKLSLRLAVMKDVLA